MEKNKSLVEILHKRAVHQDSGKAYVFLENGEVEKEVVNYRQLHHMAGKVAATMLDSHRKGDRALLLLPSGIDYIAAFFGCLYAGIVAVPVYPPRGTQHFERLEKIRSDAQSTLIVTDSYHVAKVKRYFCNGDHTAQHIRIVVVDDGSLSDVSPLFDTFPDESDIAFLQYTSGSTGDPKGVMVSHKNLMVNLNDLDKGFRHDGDSVMITWLPIFHDMGLIYGILMPLYKGFKCYFMSPAVFLQRPIRWLSAFSKYRGTHTAAPNFAYTLCCTSIGANEQDDLDLSSWRGAINAAEPVRAESLDEFMAKFEVNGLKRGVICPGYGLAETTLKVTCVDAGKDYDVLHVDTDFLERNIVRKANAGSSRVAAFISCGTTAIDTDIRIVDPESQMELASGKVGEIWVGGDTVALGYWDNKKVTEETFNAYIKDSKQGPYLRTGDLGFLHNGELYVTGRLKDLIIIRGANHYPQDIEMTVGACHDALVRGNCAAFSIDVDEEERLVVVQEVKRTHRSKIDPEKIFELVRGAIGSQHGLDVYAIALLRPASVLKTSSGKIQHRACKQAFLDEDLAVIAQWKSDSGHPQINVEPSLCNRTVVADIKEWITQSVAQMLGTGRAAMKSDVPLGDLGLDSLKLVRLSGVIADKLGISLSPTVIFDYPTIDALARHLANVGQHQPLSIQGGTDAGPYQVAVVGMACRFPGAENISSFWQLLTEGRNAVQEVPENRWSLREYYSAEPKPGKMNCASGGFLEGVDMFDGQFFGITPREADMLDPQQRLLLEVAWECLEDAGLAPERLAGTNTGVFVGISTQDYSLLRCKYGLDANAYFGTGNAFSIAANRLSYFLDVHGPSMAIDTACSSSLVGVHDACQSLLRGESELALAGGVNLMLAPELSVTFSQAGMLSPEGQCKTFDQSADGYVRGEGCGVLLLKPLAAAQRDNDRIYAVIQGSAVNQDGRSNGLTAPSGLAQQAVVKQGLRRAGMRSAQIGYIEAHGTGTPLGDPVEFNALTAVFSGGREEDQGPCWVGSVKTNIGHLESAAGVAGLIKSVLAVHHGQIPQHLNFTQLNPLIDLSDSPLRIPDRKCQWSPVKGTRVAGVSSFGFGGTNAHVIVEEYSPPQSEKMPETLGLLLLPLSAKCAESLTDLARACLAHINANSEQRLADVCYTASCGRSHHEHRLVVSGTDRIEISNGLQDYIDTNTAGAYHHGHVTTAKESKLVFLFSGQGTQYPNMGRELYESYPVFRNNMDLCSEILAPVLGCKITELIYGDNVDQVTLNRTANAQPCLFALEYALYKLWQSWGLKADVVVGHSLGEYVAACVAGVFSLEDGLNVVAQRAALMQSLPEQGKMVAIYGDVAKTIECIKSGIGNVSIAAINSSDSIVISGDNAGVDSILKIVADEAVQVKQLDVSHAFHSPLMKPIEKRFLEVVSAVKLNVPTIKIISNLTGELCDSAMTDPGYWVDHMLAPVRFASCMEQVKKEDAVALVEIGPRPVLLGLAKNCGIDILSLPSLRPNTPDVEQVLDSFSALYAAGIDMDWRQLYSSEQHSLVSLPTYPFARHRHWLTMPEPGQAEAFPARAGVCHSDLPGIRLSLAGSNQVRFENCLKATEPEFINDHRVFDLPVMPATGFVEIVLATARALEPDKHINLEFINICSPLIFREDRQYRVQTVVETVDDERRLIRVYSQAVGSDDQKNDEWTRHVNAEVRFVNNVDDYTLTRLDVEHPEFHNSIDVTEFYELNAQRGLNYQNTFQVVKELRFKENSAIARLELHSTVMTGNDYVIHPALLDGCLQAIGSILPLDMFSRTVPVPVRFEMLRLFKSPPETVWVKVERLHNNGGDKQEIRAKLMLFDARGEQFGIVESISLRRISQAVLQEHDETDRTGQWFYSMDWIKREAVSTVIEDQNAAWIVFDNGSHELDCLITHLTALGTRCVVARIGQKYLRISETEYVIDPANAGDFRLLLGEVAGDSARIGGVVFGWSLERDRDNGGAVKLDDAVNGDVLSVLYLAQALIDSGVNERVKFAIMTRGCCKILDEDRVDGIVNTPLLGMARVIQREHPEINCIEMDLPESVRDLPLRIFITDVLGQHGDGQITYRQGDRHIAVVRRQQSIESPGAEISRTGCYLVTGGLGDLGLQVATRLIQQGARDIVLTGRSGASKAVLDSIRALEESGARITIKQTDVADFEAMRRDLAEFLPKLKGVIHAAGVLDDKILSYQNSDSIKKVMMPKASGAWNLHKLTEELSLDFFIMFSSIASFFGSQGQANYAAANSFLDGLAFYRQARGLPALSVNWGPWKNIGMAQRHNVGELLEAIGVKSISPLEGGQLIDKLFTIKEPQLAVVDIDWPKFMVQFSGHQAPSLFSVLGLVSEVGNDSGRLKQVSDVLLDILNATNNQEMTRLITEYLFECFHKIAGLNKDQQTELRDNFENKVLIQMGVDSLMASEVRNRITTDLDVNLPMQKVMGDTSVAEIVNYIRGRLVARSLMNKEVISEEQKESEDEYDILEL